MTRGGRRPTGADRPAGDRESTPDRVPRMRDVAHVHGDHDPRAWHWFARGPTVAADGGGRGTDEREGRRADDGEREDPRNVEEERIRDVSHEPATGDGANRVWERGDDRDEEERATR